MEQNITTLQWKWKMASAMDTRISQLRQSILFNFRAEIFMEMEYSMLIAHKYSIR